MAAVHLLLSVHRIYRPLIISTEGWWCNNRGWMMLGSDNAIWDDGEWISWSEINDQIQYKEWRARFPNADLSIVSTFEHLISIAEGYFLQTGKHLQVYGDIGELYGVITHGLKLHENYAEGSDGIIGDALVEVKTITPFKRTDTVVVNLKRNFDKLLIVNINGHFEVRAKLIDRSMLPPCKGEKLTLHWDDFSNEYREPDIADLM